jgi:hypothetical protein
VYSYLPSPNQFVDSAHSPALLPNQAACTGRGASLQLLEEPSSPTSGVPAPGPHVTRACAMHGSRQSRRLGIPCFGLIVGWATSSQPSAGSCYAAWGSRLPRLHQLGHHRPAQPRPPHLRRPRLPQVPRPSPRRQARPPPHVVFSLDGHAITTCSSAGFSISSYVQPSWDIPSKSASGCIDCILCCT